MHINTSFVLIYFTIWRFNFRTLTNPFCGKSSRNGMLFWRCRVRSISIFLVSVKRTTPFPVEDIEKFPLLTWKDMRILYIYNSYVIIYIYIYIGINSGTPTPWIENLPFDPWNLVCSVRPPWSSPPIAGPSRCFRGLFVPSGETSSNFPSDTGWTLRREEPSVALVAWPGVSIKAMVFFGMTYT